MKNIKIIRKRYIPNEEVDISDDCILVNTDNILITKWMPIKPRNDFAWGISYVDLKDNYKISRFYDKNNEFLYWYCDILELKIIEHRNNLKYILTDLLIDIIIYPNGHYEIKDIDELEEALEKELIDKNQYETAVFAMKRLVENISKGNFPPKEFNYKDFEKGHVDLHLHSSYSDGTLTPAQLVNMAKSMNLSAISLTDHDCIDGIPEAEAAAAKAGLEFIQGVEFSANYIHILGYFPNGGIERLNGVFQTYMENRRIRADKTARRLTDLGMPVTYDEIVEEAGGERFIGRMDFARVLVKKGYTKSIKEAFTNWLGDGEKAYIKKDGYSVYEIIEIINKFSGVPVLAHPKQLKMGKGKRFELIKHLKECGLKGLEVYYSDNTISETREYIEIARLYELIMTGGSDFHGLNKPDIKMGTGKGKLVVPYECMNGFKNFRI